MGPIIKCTIFIFNVLLYHAVNGCTFTIDNCTCDVYCSGSLFYLPVHDLLNEQRHCLNKMYSIYDSSLYEVGMFIPVRLFISHPVYGEKLPVDDESISLLPLVVSFDVSGTGLNDMPIFSTMTHLQTLNLSNNYLQVAKLCNEEKLSALENIDLSHNIINTIQIAESQYKYRNLRMLNLSHNLLTDIAGGIFASLNDLENLDLSYNHLTIIDQNSFEGLQSLKYLYLSENGISDINSSLFRFINLEELCLNSNDIQNVLSRDFNNLNLLQKLDLTFNKISRIDKDTFSNMQFLTTLKLDNNLLAYIHKDAFSQTVNLKAVSLSNNLLKNLPKHLFRNKNITLFSVTENHLEGPIFRGTFEGLRLIIKLDISFQEITTIEEYAFFDLEELRTLLLNNNKISVVSKRSFKNLKQLRQLDLSNNLIVNIDFDKTELFYLESLSLGKNFINLIQPDDFHGLTELRVLDLSSNNITKIEPNSFKFMETIETFQISHNPLSGALINNSFEGLPLVPVLDLSCTSLTSILNGSFSGMFHIQDLNISHSSINLLEFNAFVNTGSLKLLDLSYNKLIKFFVNSDDLKNITTIILNNNNLIHISSYAFKDMRFLNKIILSYNSIANIEIGAFADQADLRYLDLSFNNNLTFKVSVLDKARNLDKLFLSSLKNEIDFRTINRTSLRELTISHSRNIYNVSKLQLNSIMYLTNLDLNNNSIVSLELGAFKNLTVLNWLDLSLNNISYIQPSTFKDNILLYKLNLSHNSLTSLNYGTFRGLDSLNILDVSFNNILHLQRAQFYDIQKLEVLIVDHNKITEISEDFFHIQLVLLSIGDNPLSCERIAYMKYKERINVSAINKDEITNHNIDGITCGKNKHLSESGKSKNNDGEQIEIRKILLNLSTEIQHSKLPVDNRYNDALKKLFGILEKHDTDETRALIQLNNSTHQMADEVERSNTLLERIFKAIVGLGSQQNKPKIASTVNATDSKHNNSFFESNSKLLFEDVNQIKQELLYLKNVISEIDMKIIADRTLNTPLVPEKSNNSHKNEQGNKDESFIFVEVCVSLILIILVFFILYKIYQTKIFISSSRSLSTRHITDSMDNSNL